MNSKLYDAQDELTTLLQGAAGLAGVTKALGTPLKLSDLQEVVWVSGEVEDWNAEYRVSGLQAKDEFFTLRVHCLVTRTGDFKAARDRAKALATAVEDVVIADKTLNGSVELAQTKSAALEEARLDERKHQVLITIYVNCRAWLA